MEINKILLEIKDRILVDAISAVDIIDVDEKFLSENNIALYIKTSDVKTVNSEKLAEICENYSTEEIYVTFLVPLNKVTDNGTIPNVDSVCIFIEK